MPFDLMFGWEMKVPLDVMISGATENEYLYSEFAADRRDNLEPIYREVRKNLKVAQ